MQAARELLVGEQRGDGRIARERLGLVGVERAYELVERGEDRDVRRARRPAWNAANIWRLRCSGSGEPIATTRVPGPTPWRATARRPAAIPVAMSSRS